MKRAFLKKLAKEMVKRGEAEDWKDCYKDLLKNKEEIFDGMAAEIRKSRSSRYGEEPNRVNSN